MAYFGDFFRATGTRPRTTTNAVGGAWGSVKCGNRTNGSLSAQAAGYYSNQQRSNGRTYKGVAMPTSAATPTTDGQMTIPNPWTGVTHNTNTNYNFTGMIDQVAVFASQTAAAQVNYSTDVVGVTSATIVGSNLVVVASSSKAADCSTLTLQYGTSSSSPFGTSCTKSVPYSYPGDGLRIGVVSSSAPSVPVKNFQITPPAPVANNAVDDSYANVAASGDTDLAVLANDTGSNISIQSVSQPTLGSVAINGNTIRYTAAGEGSTSFTYTIAGTISGVNTATVTITAIANAAPTLSISTPSGQSVTAGTSYNITYSLADADSVATAAFSYDTDATGYNGTAISGACASAAEGTNVTCTWDTTGMTPGTYYVYGVATDGVNSPVNSPYSGTLTITAAPAGVAALDTWANVYSGVPTASPVAAGSVTVGSGSQRLLLVAVVMEYSTAANPTISATYGGTALTQIKISANSQREAVWMGYLADAGIGSGAKALSVTYTGAIGTVSSMHVKWAAFTGVNQSTPVVSSNAVSAGATTVASNAAVSYVTNGMTVAVSGNGGTPAAVAVTANPTLTPGTITTSNAQSSQSFVSTKHTSTGSYTSGGISFSWSGTSTSNRSAMAAASLQP